MQKYDSHDNVRSKPLIVVDSDSLEEDSQLKSFDKYMLKFGNQAGLHSASTKNAQRRDLAATE